jgi:putative intracellular protease/amidase
MKMKVFLYVLNTMADWEIGFITAELNSKRYFKNKDLDVTLIKVGEKCIPIKTMGGIDIQPDIDIDSMKIKNDDLLLLPGADTWFDEQNAKVLEIAKYRIDNNLGVAAICGATIGLARIGALNKIKHTSNDKNYLKAICPNYKGEDHYIDLPAVTDKKTITASGIAPLEFSYEVLKLLDVYKKDTLENWYNLYTKKEPKYFFGLMNSIT